LVKFLDQIDAP